MMHGAYNVKLKITELCPLYAYEIAAAPSGHGPPRHCHLILYFFWRGEPFTASNIAFLTDFHLRDLLNKTCSNLCTSSATCTNTTSGVSVKITVLCRIADRNALLALFFHTSIGHVCGRFYVSPPDITVKLRDYFKL